MDANARKRARLVSRALLGSSYRLEVAAAIAAGQLKPVYARALNAQIQVGDNQVAAVLQRFEKAGIVRRLPSSPSLPR
ncbi:MAG TPA: hypothetical protein VMV16_00015 [Solirubrobacteraceae bacterium]|nr:hypothetical protein [Solirubrobacteraceae bacterium]